MLDRRLVIFLVSLVFCLLGIADWPTHFGKGPTGAQPYLLWPWPVILTIVGGLMAFLYAVLIVESIESGTFGKEESKEEEKE